MPSYIDSYKTLVFHGLDLSKMRALGVHNLFSIVEIKKR